MSDLQPPERRADLPPPTPAPSVAAPSPTVRYAMVPVGHVPPRLGGPYYSPGLVILLSFVTLFIWTFLWAYRTNEDLKKYNGDGLGGVLAIVIMLVINYFGHAILMFTIPGEIQKMYQRDGRQSPVSAVWGLWFLLPIIGNIVWYLKVQRALNDFWLSKGALPG